MCLQEPKSGPFSEPDQSYHFLCFSLNIAVYQLTWQHDTIMFVWICHTIFVVYVCVCRHACIVCLSYIYETNNIQGSYRGITEDSGLTGNDAVSGVFILAFQRIVSPSSSRPSSWTAHSWRWHTVTQRWRLRVASGATAPGPALEGAPRFKPKVVLWVCQAIFSGKLEMLIHAPFKILLQGQIT